MDYTTYEQLKDEYADNQYEGIIGDKVFERITESPYTETKSLGSSGWYYGFTWYQVHELDENQEKTGNSFEVYIKG